LEGEQGIGKSTAIRTLAKDWFCDMDLDAGNRDMINVMFGKWIIELNELAGMSFAKMNSVKSFISRQTDTARLAYDSAARDYSRQSVFIGTINPSGGYLSDDTGNRRFWVLHCKKVDIIGLEKAVDQLWAEAMEAYKDEKLYLSPEASVLQVRETNARRPEDSYLSLVRDFLDAHPAVDEATAIQVFAFAGRSAANVNIGDQQRIARIFRDLGWGSKHNSINGTNERYFTRPISEIVSREMGDL
jgi:predicted P-loop ATPase